MCSANLKNENKDFCNEKSQDNGTGGSKIIRALEIIRVKKLIANAVL